MSYRDDYFDANTSDHGWYTCVSCGKKLRRADADIDHIIPQYHGGLDSLDNLQCMCRHCNRSKKADMKYTQEDLVANMTGIRLGTRDVIDELDRAADQHPKRHLF